MYIPLHFVGPLVAKELSTHIYKHGGVPSPDRVLILSPKDQDTQVGSIILPGTNKEDIPNKGVVIIPGEISNEYNPYRDMVKPGKIVTYGMYAGKEISFDPTWFPENLDLSKHKFTILSLTEVLFSENNPLDL